MGKIATSFLVNEIFTSLQGEGTWVGRKAVFFRLQGCRVLCPFCDTKVALTRDPRNLTTIKAILAKKQPSPQYAILSLEESLDILLSLSEPGSLVVLTGGEPLWQNLSLLTAELLSAQRDVQIETSGTEPPSFAEKTWITLSPKKKPVLPVYWKRANEIKFPISTPKDLAPYEELLIHLPPKKIFLQPVSCSKEATELCVRLCQENNWRLSLQIHKYIHIP